MHKVIFICIISICINLTASSSHADQVIIAQKVEKAPLIDGISTDNAWNGNKGIVTYDRIAGLDIIIKAACDDDEIFFLIEFPDNDESREHKTWMWDKKDEMYKRGPQREDVIVLKWSMEPEKIDLSVHGDKPYNADIWFWKACRTDPAGYADDKLQQLQFNKYEKALKIKSKSGHDMYLTRTGDKGTSAYKNDIFLNYRGDTVPQFSKKTPTGSRADIRAKGVWSNGKWTIELKRKLITGNNDDIQFKKGSKYQFGISRYEIAGRPPDESLSQPLYGSGDTSEDLYLKFEE